MNAKPDDRLLVDAPPRPGLRRDQHERRERGEASQLFGMGGVRELAELAGDEVRRLLADVDGVVADPLEAARDDEHPQTPFAVLGVEPEHPLGEPRFVRSISSSRSTSASARARSRCWNERSATRVISSARTPISASAATILVSAGTTPASFVSFATVTQ